MLEHYHNINSVCAQKVRIAIKEKALDVKEHLLTLRGDQHDPAYRKLNPNGVVPTLVHDGKPVIESSLILYYLDDAFPDPPLMPREPPTYSQLTITVCRTTESASVAIEKKTPRRRRVR